MLVLIQELDVISQNLLSSLPFLLCTQFFSSRAINSWNKLSEETITAESLDIFKQTLDAE